VTALTALPVAPSVVEARVTPEELIAHCRERMAAYTYPRQVEVIDELPKTASGKILRRELGSR
jgi:long-chain acyl-CoA synthetase